MFGDGMPGKSAFFSRMSRAPEGLPKASSMRTALIRT